MIKAALQVAGVLLVVAFCLGILKGYLDTPTVYMSSYTHKVVRIEYPNGMILQPTKDQIPEKYEIVWVK